jgi:hypothetical protein
MKIAKIKKFMLPQWALKQFEGFGAIWNLVLYGWTRVEEYLKIVI